MQPSAAIYGSKNNFNYSVSKGKGKKLLYYIFCDRRKCGIKRFGGEDIKIAEIYNVNNILI